ncbi:MAG TPA: CocE/NonD family hydrolase [Rhizorhapis sp.]|nr:CocE/NonD family hydrolase [Rhizorhapis sp.]
MFSTDWSLSPREYGVVVERGIKIPVADGIELQADVYRPDAGGRFPVLFAPSPYSLEPQTAPMMPVGFTYPRAWLESGDPSFFVRRGYVMVVATIRGARGSTGYFSNIEPNRETVQDIYEAIGWLAAQPWADGKVGMLGASYFAVLAKRVAALKPEALKAIFSMYGLSDGYRDFYYHGGIYAHTFFEYWHRRQNTFLNTKNQLREDWGEEKYDAAVKTALADPDIRANPWLVHALENPDEAHSPQVNELTLQPLDGPFYRERSVDFSADTSIPGYFGADWGLYGIHLGGDIRAFEKWKGPSRLTIGPPLYLDRPLYQYAYEALRWFDHWLKGNDTGMLEEPPVQLFIQGTGEWKKAHSWPLPETRWTPFYLHDGGLLSEHEFWPSEGSSSYEDGSFHRGEVKFWTPKFVEATEFCGPVALKLYGSTTSDEVLWFVTLLHQDAEGNERTITRGWLRGSQRELDREESRPWRPYHKHTSRDPLEPGRIYEFDIEVNAIGLHVKPGEKIGLRIKSADNEEAQDIIEHMAMGHIARVPTSRVTVHHNADHPSQLLLPVTKGNIIGTFISGGDLPPLDTTARIN